MDRSLDRAARAAWRSEIVPQWARLTRPARVVLGSLALIVALGVLALALSACTGVSVAPGVANAPNRPVPDVPWEPAPPVDPPPPPPPPPVGDVPAVGTSRAVVEAAWGMGTDLPENPGEPDSVLYVRTIGGREAEVHVIYKDGRVLRAVVSFLVTPGGR